MLVVKGAIVDHYSSSAKGYGRGRMFGEDGNNTEATFSLFKVTLLASYTVCTTYNNTLVGYKNTH